ncbi:hypothetical protein A8144_07615 [Mycobacterium leprae 3125609]|nr:hypothetical protein A8144_03565 [Mycobacterium leprae 3125609]OAX70213.1 hypothetical protein A3216_13320 [Mycobacterium leprae 7935681]OAR20339.1 hypothetical protein A8144_11370 [Mycobacterium leprae 3125609]OAR21216.1 hypothetical protein A8144_07615 [Mycobacterium leprae 3125609]OAX70649.1 hypothetical protein A3216_10600 [Mycobacterium leprae 7935681]
MYAKDRDCTAPGYTVPDYYYYWEVHHITAYNHLPHHQHQQPDRLAAAPNTTSQTQRLNHTKTHQQQHPIQ